MLFAGAAYGLLWTFFMAIKNFKKILNAIKKNYADKKLRLMRLITGLLCIIMLLGLYFLPYIESQFKIILSVFILVIYLMNYLIIFVKSVEGSSINLGSSYPISIFENENGYQNFNGRYTETYIAPGARGNWKLSILPKNTNNFGYSITVGDTNSKK
jgi:CDP-diglyceride synthetase